MLRRVNINLDEIDYVIVPGKPTLSFEGVEVYNQLYSYWKQYWQSHYQGMGEDIKVDSLDFYRQDKITALLQGAKIISMNLLSTYNLSCEMSDHPYFSSYDQEFFTRMKEEGINLVQSFQYLMVDSEWTARKTGVNFGAIIAGLSIKHQLEDNLDGGITLARSDVPSASTARKFNFEEFSNKKEMHHNPVVQMFCSKPSLYPKESVNSMVDHFWKNRKYLGTNEQIKRINKEAM